MPAQVFLHLVEDLIQLGLFSFLSTYRTLRFVELICVIFELVLSLLLFLLLLFFGLLKLFDRIIGFLFLFLQRLGLVVELALFLVGFVLIFLSLYNLRVQLLKRLILAMDGVLRC